LLGGGLPCDGRRPRGQRHSGGRCGASGGVVGEEAAVQDTVEAVGERRWCTDHAGVVGRRRCCRGRGGGATDDRGGCSGVFVFYLHMGMGEMHWREEVDPIIKIQ
jgi:hypothetical protein